MGYDWEEWIDIIDEMLLDPDYEFANDTLEGIKYWVSEHEHITDKQVDAVNNIKFSVER